jgi:hypothetical protein
MVRKILLSVLVVCSVYGQPQTTTIVDTLYDSVDGKPFNGIAIVSGPNITNGGTNSVLAISRSIPIINGVFTVSVVPNQTSLPASFYTISFTEGSGKTVDLKSCNVPYSATPLNLVGAGCVDGLQPQTPGLIALSQLAQAGATVGQAMCWLGFQWGPGNCGGGSGNLPGFPDSFITPTGGTPGKTLLLQDQTPGTGVTTLTLRSGAGQLLAELLGSPSGDLIDIRDVNNNQISHINGIGQFRSTTYIIQVPDVSGNIGNRVIGLSAFDNSIEMSANTFLVWTADPTNFFNHGNWDTGIRRLGPGILAISQGLSNLWGKIALDNSTPASSSDPTQCTIPQTMWADGNYVYVCVSAGHVKRATLNDF